MSDYRLLPYTATAPGHCHHCGVLTPRGGLVIEKQVQGEWLPAVVPLCSEACARALIAGPNPPVSAAGMVQPIYPTDADRAQCQATALVKLPDLIRRIDELAGEVGQVQVLVGIAGHRDLAHDLRRAGGRILEVKDELAGLLPQVNTVEVVHA